MTLRIGSHPIGAGAPCFLVAELSGNHNGDLGRALAMVDAAKDAGAHAVKLQTYTPDTLTMQSARPEFVVSGTGPWAGRTLYDLYQEAQTPWAWHEPLFTRARAIGLEAFSTPFDHSAVDLLDSLDVPAHKIASFELIDDGLLRRVAESGKPVILSTGMATLEEIAHAVAVLREAGAEDIVLLHCTSSYPAPDEAMRLATIPVLAQATGCPTGLSDHSRGTVAPVVAVTLGACLIEKHLTLSRADGGVDSHFSLEPQEFRELHDAVSRAEQMVGSAALGPIIAETENRTFRRSLFVVQDLEAGEEITPGHVRSIRPGNGLAPRFLDLIVGRRAARSAERGTPVSWDLIGDVPVGVAS